MEITHSQWQAICDNAETALGSEVRITWLDCLWPLSTPSATTLRLGAATPHICETVTEHYLSAIQNAAALELPSLPIVEVHVAVKSEVPVLEPHLRSLPATAAQGDLFIPDIAEIAIKEDVHLMKIAPFTLQPRGETRTELSYNNVNGTNIRIVANPTYGMITAEDHDIFLMMKSWLADKANHYRAELRRYEAHKQAGKSYREPTPPPRYFTPSARDILLFKRDYETSGGKTHRELQDRLNRLKSSTVHISKAVGSRHRRYGTFSFVADWSILAHTKTGEISQVRIDIPNWVYEGIVEAPKPSILTYHHDYMLLKKPLMQFIYRYCRSLDVDIPNAGETTSVPTADLHYNSASRSPMKEFNRKLSEAIKRLPDGRFFNWELKIEGVREQRRLVVTQARKMDVPATAA